MSSEGRAVLGSEKLVVSRRELLKLSGSALAFVAGCEGAGSGSPPAVTEPPRETAANPLHAAAHRRHRIAFLMGDVDLEDTCTLDCTAAFSDHEYGGTSTWH